MTIFRIRFGRLLLLLDFRSWRYKNVEKTIYWSGLILMESYHIYNKLIYYFKIAKNIVFFG